MSAQGATQAGVVAALLADASYMALVTGVYDGVPAGTAYPYTVVGDTTETGHHTHDADGWELTLTIHDWSAHRGTLECQQLLRARNAVLHRTILTGTGFQFTQLVYEFGEIMREKSGDHDLRHQVTRYRTIVKETS